MPASRQMSTEGSPAKPSARWRPLSRPPRPAPQAEGKQPEEAPGPAAGGLLGRAALTLIYLTGIILLGACGLVGFYQWQHIGRIFPGVSAAGLHLGGLTPQEAEARLVAV
ncbi:MAG: hypothetical protein GX605_05220, partial [Chloroflexi bacterium]|nr:hypothetical protein [Chloroflexota bacterium]